MSVAQPQSSDLQAKVLAQKSIDAALRVLIEDFAAQDRTLHIVQVGACNGEIEADPLHPLIKGQAHIQAHLVEAVGWLYERLSQVMAPYADTIHCHHAAIGPRDETRLFYSASQRFGLENPDVPDWRKVQIGALSDEHLKLHVPQDYIQSALIGALSPKTFMHNIGMKPEDLNLLVTDTEGFDGEIVGAFLDICAPDVILFEHNVMAEDEREQLMTRLDTMGYRSKRTHMDTLSCKGARHLPPRSRHDL